MALTARVLGLIPARAGSQRLPGKNTRIAHGLPLIVWTIREALQTHCLDHLVVSSDDAKIMRIAQQYGAEAPFQRPASLATAQASSIDVVLHALDELPPYDWVMLLQPTSPQRLAQDIDQAWVLTQQHAAPACVSVRPGSSTPHAGSFTLTPENQLRTAAGDSAEIYALNGAIYLARTDWLRNTRNFITPDTLAYVMPPERSIDIDTEEDFERFIRDTAPHALPPTSPR